MTTRLRRLVSQTKYIVHTHFTFALKRSTFNLHHPPTSPLPPLPPQPPRIVLSPSVMHAPPSAWPQHHTLLDAPALNFALNFALSDPHTSRPLTLGLSASASRTRARTRLLGLILSTLSDVQTSPSGLSDDISPRRHLLTSHLSPSYNLSLSDARATLCACKLTGLP
jgi:hypothetical protein